MLVGPPGAGKTTVGRALAAAAGLAFRDTDLDVEQVAGASISDLFVDEGEEAFRQREAEAVRAALAQHEGVLSLGGGAVLRADTRRLLADETVVFLAVGLAEATRRVGLSAARPVLAINPRAQLQQLLEQRLPLYREVASCEVDTTGKTADEVADEVRTALGW